MERGLATKKYQANEHQIMFETQWGTDNIFGHTPLFFPYAARQPDRAALRRLVRQRRRAGQGAAGADAGADGRCTARRPAEPDEERIKLGKQAVGISVDEAWIINVVANSPASQGVRVVKNTLGNVPERVWNSAVSDNPMIGHPETYFFK